MTDKFTWITSDTIPEVFITIEKFKRIYFSVDTQKLIGIGPSREVYIGYDHANKRVIVANPETVRPANVVPHRIDERGYTSARPFLREIGLDNVDERIRFKYIGKDYYVNGAHVFEMIDEKAGEDGTL